MKNNCKFQISNLRFGIQNPNSGFAPCVLRHGGHRFGRAPESGVPLGSGKRDQRGVALLFVLWLTVALSLIAMATAQMVRTEVAAVGNQIDWQRSYYLARGGIDAAIYSIVHSAQAPPAPDAPVLPSDFLPGKRWLQFDLPGGSCTVEIVPENGKLSINQIPPEQLATLFVSLSIQPENSVQLAAAIAEWRSPRASEVDSVLDLQYANLPEPYLARHAPLDYLEELLPVMGMSRSLFFGRTERSPEGQWQKWPPLADLLTTLETGNSVNPNYAATEVLETLPGWDGATAAAVVAARAVAPFRSMDDLLQAVPQVSTLAGTASLTLQAGPVYTLTATGSVPGSPVRRSVRALILVDSREPLYHRVLGWWDDWPIGANSQ